VKRLKISISLFLLVVAVTFSMNLHGWSHIFEDHHNDTNHNQCEVCLINYQKNQKTLALEPQPFSLEFYSLDLLQVNRKSINSSQNLAYYKKFIGQLFNRPPPFYI
jgi:hypothetical protein